MQAVDEFRRVNKINFPASSEIYRVVRLLGYRKSQVVHMKACCQSYVGKRFCADCGAAIESWSADLLKHLREHRSKLVGRSARSGKAVTPEVLARWDRWIAGLEQIN